MSDTQGQKDMGIFKDAAILAGWIAGLILVAGLFWFFTQPVRNRILLSAVNQVLEQSGDSRMLGTPVPTKALRPGVSKVGSWYTMIERTQVEPPIRRRSGQSAAPEMPDPIARVFVFAFIGEGTFFPCAALVNLDGKTEGFIPLNKHGERMLNRVSPKIIELYTRRIEGAESP